MTTLSGMPAAAAGRLGGSPARGLPTRAPEAPFISQVSKNVTTGIFGSVPFLTLARLWVASPGLGREEVRGFHWEKPGGCPDWRVFPAGVELCPRVLK